MRGASEPPQGDRVSPDGEVNGILESGAWRWRTLVCLFAALSVLSQTDVARAEPPASVSVGVERFPDGRQAIFRLTATAGENGAAFGFSYQPPPWPWGDRLSRERNASGSPISVRSVQLSGPGSLSQLPGIVPPPALRLFICDRNDRAVYLSNRYWVEVPAGATTNVELIAKGVFPSWPGTRYQLSFSTFADKEKYWPLQTLQATTEALSPRGVLIRMREAGEAEEKGAKTSPEIVGATEPPFRHARIALRAIRLPRPNSLSLGAWSSPSAVRLGAVQTDERGHFRLPPQPLPPTGWYAFLARSEARGAFAADWNCGPFFTVGP